MTIFSISTTLHGPPMIKVLSLFPLQVLPIYPCPSHCDNAIPNEHGIRIFSSSTFRVKRLRNLNISDFPPLVATLARPLRTNSENISNLGRMAVNQGNEPPLLLSGYSHLSPYYHPSSFVSFLHSNIQCLISTVFLAN